MDDQDVSEDARKNQEPKQNSVYSEDLGHGIIRCMATLFTFYRVSVCFIEENKKICHT